MVSPAVRPPRIPVRSTPAYNSAVVTVKSVLSVSNMKLRDIISVIVM